MNVLKGLLFMGQQQQNCSIPDFIMRTECPYSVNNVLWYFEKRKKMNCIIL